MSRVLQFARHEHLGVDDDRLPASQQVSDTAEPRPDKGSPSERARTLGADDDRRPRVSDGQLNGHPWPRPLTKVSGAGLLAPALPRLGLCASESGALSARLKPSELGADLLDPYSWA